MNRYFVLLDLQAMHAAGTDNAVRHSMFEQSARLPIIKVRTSGASYFRKQYARLIKRQRLKPGHFAIAIARVARAAGDRFPF